MEKSPKVGREYEKPDFIALALLAIMRCLKTPTALPKSTAIVRQSVAVRFLIEEVWHGLGFDWESENGKNREG